MAEQNSLHALAVAHGTSFAPATDNPELPDTAYAATRGSEFGRIAPGNSMKWDTTEPQQGQFTLAKSDVITDFAPDHGQTVRGHTLVLRSQLPAWVTSMPSAQVEAAMTNHNAAVAGPYRGEVAARDVVNEPLNDDRTFRTSPFRKAMGSGYIATALRTAHPADPDAELYINDGNTEGLGAKSDAMYSLARELVAEGVPIDGVGFQGHLAVQYGVAAMSSPKTGADRYLEVGLGSGSLAAGTSTGEIQPRLDKTDRSNFDKADDYSRTTGTAFTDASHVGISVDGDLVWGTEP
ncbi:endo-1,4-beta-xylanase [Streptomyces sp. NPDC055006]